MGFEVRVWGSRLGVWGLGFGLGLGARGRGVRCLVWGFVCGFSGLGCRV